MPVNRGWTEPEQGTTIYLADNGVHADIIMPIEAAGARLAAADPDARFRRAPTRTPAGSPSASGEQRVYLDTPTWWDITPRTIWSALAGGKRVMHVEYVRSPGYAARQIRLRPEEYRRLWAAIRADFALDQRPAAATSTIPATARPTPSTAATGKASAIRTCNSWAARKLRLAGVKTSPWPPFAQGLVWRYRRYNGLGLLEAAGAHSHESRPANMNAAAPMMHMKAPT